MSDHKHQHNEHKHGEPLSRRSAAKHTLNILLGMGVAMLGLWVPGRKAKGYGACTIGGCSCQGFQGQGEVCTYCGHEFTWHSN
jgi:hypothetical protein